MVDPEPYEIPPVAARYRANGNSEPAEPMSFELPSRAERTAAQRSVATDPQPAVPTPAGGPKFGGSQVAGLEGGHSRRPLRRVDPPPPLPGTFKTEWSLPEPNRWRRVRSNVARVLVLALVAGGAYAAYPHVRDLVNDHSVPAALRAYMSGKGVQYSPAAQGYAVRLPSQPVTRDSQVPAAGGEPSLFVRRSIVAGPDFEIVISEVALGSAAPLANGLGVLHDSQLVGVSPIDVHPSVVAGVAAFDYSLASNPPIHARLFVHGGHLYVVSVQSKSASSVLDALAKSFRLTP